MTKGALHFKHCSIYEHIHLKLTTFSNKIANKD